MSNSYRKPHAKDGYGKKWKKDAKRQANKKIRRLPVDEELADGSSFKKVYESWNICDFNFYCPDNEELTRK